jgi:hypothetical protein
MLPPSLLYRALWKCENGYLNRVVQLRIKAVTCYANQQRLGTTRYFTWYRYFSLPSFTNISSCGEGVICCMSRWLWHVAILFDICGIVSCLMLCFMGKLLLCAVLYVGSISVSEVWKYYCETETGVCVCVCVCVCRMIAVGLSHRDRYT